MITDRELVNQFIKKRSEDAFRSLYRSKTPDLYRLALNLCKQDKYQAEEAIQEMWIVGIRKLAHFEWRSSLQTWLSGILINVMRSQQTKASNQQKNLEESLKGKEMVVLSAIYTAYDLTVAIDRLPDGYKQVIVLHDIEGYTHKEIGEMLNINEGTSKSQLFYARKAVRIYLSEQNTKTDES